MRKVRHLLIILAVASAPAVGATWVPVTTSTTGAVWSVDATSIADVQDGYATARKVWIKIDYSKVRTEIANSAKALFFFKCVDEQSKATTWVLYKSDGTVLKDITSSYPTYSPVVPETVLGDVMTATCGVKLGQ